MVLFALTDFRACPQIERYRGPVEVGGVAVGYITEGIVQGRMRRRGEGWGFGRNVAYWWRFSGHTGVISIGFQRFSWSFFPLMSYLKGRIPSNFSNGCD